MSAFFSNAFITALTAAPTSINGATIQVVLFRDAPAFVNNDARYTGITTVSELLDMPGWIPEEPGGAPLVNTIVVTLRDEGTNNYVTFTSFIFEDLELTEVKAVAFLTGGNVIFVTDTPFDGVKHVLHDGDGVTASPDSTLSGSNNRWL